MSLLHTGGRKAFSFAAIQFFTFLRGLSLIFANSLCFVPPVSNLSDSAGLSRSNNVKNT